MISLPDIGIRTKRRVPLSEGILGRRYVAKPDDSLERIHSLKQKSSELRDKLNKITNKSTENALGSKLRLHRLLWKEETKHLAESEKQLEYEIVKIINGNFATSASLQDIEFSVYVQDRFQDCKDAVAADHQEFSSQISDLRFATDQVKELSRAGRNDARRSVHMEFVKDAEALKLKLEDKRAGLIEDEESVRREIKSLPKLDHADTHISPWFFDESGNVLRFQELDCLDTELRDHKMAQFAQLEQCLGENLRDLAARYEHAAHGRPFRAICSARDECEAQFPLPATRESELVKFSLLYDTYHRADENKSNKNHALFVHRMGLETGPARGGAKSVIAMEKTYLSTLSYKSQRRAIKYWFKKIRLDFMFATRDLFEKTDIITLEHQKKMHDLEKHIEATEAAHLKLHDWRERRIAELIEHSRADIEKQKEQMHAEIAAEQRALERREKQKSMISEYYRKKEDLQKREQGLHAELAEQQNIEKRERVKYNRLRIGFRNSLIEEKEQHQRHMHLVQEEMRRQKEAQLDELCQQVAPHVECDWARLVSDTVATQARLRETEFHHEEPVFQPLHGYTEKQILKDKRIRAFGMMQSQNLHNSEYAAHIINSIKNTGMRPQRKEMRSTITFSSD